MGRGILTSPMGTLHVTPSYQPMMRELGLDAEALFTDPRVRCWRSIRERENCTLDAPLDDGRTIRLHVKRHRSDTRAGADEAGAIGLLEAAGVPTTPLVAFGEDAGRSVLVTEDLTGYHDAEKLVRGGTPFEPLLLPTADLAARLHRADLHHRDLYLCHFFAKIDGESVTLALIDAARVKKLPRWPFRRRWVVKDLAQFWYSTLSLPITDEQRRRWLERYAAETKTTDINRLQRAVERKARWIARHDERLRRKQPGRNVSLPKA